MDTLIGVWRKAHVFIACAVFGQIVPIGVLLAQDKGFDVGYYDATLHLDRQHDSLWGVCTMTATADSDLSALRQHRMYLVIDSVLVNGKLANTLEQDSLGEYYVTDFGGVSRGTRFRVSTYYHAKGRGEPGARPWGGVFDSTNMMFAMGVGLTAPYVSCTRHWLPCYDLPDDKADSVDLTFLVADSDIVASNGLLVKDSLLGGHQRLFHWHVAHPIASYLLTFAVGPFEKLSIPNALGIPFDVYSFPKDTAALGLEMRTEVAKALEFFDSLYGRYPHEKVGYVLAPFGSMEHQTMITLDPVALSANITVAQHELSHQWWGDWVTCKTFDDPWLNEGFATFSESLILERFTSVNAYWTRQHQNISQAISGGSSIAMYGAPNHTMPRNNYPSAIIYDKGAAVLGMLRYYLGDSIFFTALRAYGTKHAYSTATSFDLWHDFESATGQDLGWFFPKWVFGIGYPQLRLTWTKNGNAVTLRYQQVQDSTKIGYFKLPLIVEARWHGEKERVPVWLDSSAMSISTVQFSFSPDSIVTDPDGALIKKMVSVTQDVARSPKNLPGLAVSIRNNPVNDGVLSLDVSANHEMRGVRIWIANERGGLVTTLESDTTFPKRHSIIQRTLPGLSVGAYFLMVASEDGSTGAAKFTVEK